MLDVVYLSPPFSIARWLSLDCLNHPSILWQPTLNTEFLFVHLSCGSVSAKFQYLVSSCTQSRTDQHHSAPTFQALEALVVCCLMELWSSQVVSICFYLRRWVTFWVAPEETWKYLERMNSLCQNLFTEHRFGPEPIIPDPQLQHLCYSHGRGTQRLSFWNPLPLRLRGYSSSVQRAFVSYIAPLLRFGNAWYCWGCVNWQNCWQASAIARSAADVFDVPVLFKMLRFEWTTWWSERLLGNLWKHLFFLSSILIPCHSRSTHVSFAWWWFVEASLFLNPVCCNFVGWVVERNKRTTIHTKEFGLKDFCAETCHTWRNSYSSNTVLFDKIVSGCDPTYGLLIALASWVWSPLFYPKKQAAMRFWMAFECLQGNAARHNISLVVAPLHEQAWY